MTAQHTGTKTVAKAKLAGLSTTDLIAQYELGISSYKGRLTNVAPRQQRINYIVDLISDRADKDDEVALAFYASTE